ncbi:MAG: hypothetical protein LBM61_07970 [Prevotellaceae bacterium]|nr:hypothetical protein [Prevotellaceae bacterium]
MEDKTLSQAESLELITQMIQNTRMKLGRGSGSPFLIWGYATVFTTLLVYLLLFVTGSYQALWLWFLLPVLGGLFWWQHHSHHKTVRPITYIDRMTSNIWMVCGIVGGVISVLTMLTSMEILGQVVWRFPILFVICLVMGMGTTLTGLVIRFVPVTIGGIFGICGSLAISFIQGLHVFALFALIFIGMMIIPGHMLNRAAQKAEG